MKFPYLTLDKKKIYALGCFNHEWNNDRIKKVSHYDKKIK